MTTFSPDASDLTAGYYASNRSLVSQSSFMSSGNGLTPRTVALLDEPAIQRHRTSRRTSVISSILGEGSSPIYTAIFNMLAGCGVVGLPITYKNSGLILGIVLMIFVAFISVYTLRLLVKVGKYVNVEDYERLCEKCFGKKGYYFLSITILLFDIGACLTYTIILGDSAHSVMKHLFGWNASSDRQLVILGAYCFLILPFCLGKSHDFIEKISACAIFSVTIMISVVCYFWVHEYREQKVEGIKLINTDLQQLLSAFGTISFAFVQHDQTFLVYKTLQHNTLRRYTILSSAALSIQSILCITIGIFGYLSFGSNTQSDILQNYELGNNVIVAVRIMYTLAMAFTFPTAFYVVRHIAYSLMQRNAEETFAEAAFCKRISFTMICWTFFLILGLFIDDLGFVMSLSGLVCALILAFILPCACNLQCSPYPILFWNAPLGHKWTAFWDIVPSLLLIVFGTLAAFVGTTQLIMAQFNVSISFIK